MRTAPSGARGRRTWPQRLLLSLNILLIVAALGTAAGIGYAYEKVGNLPRIEWEDDALAPTDSDGDGSPEAVNVLLVGTDRAAGLSEDDPVLSGRRNPTSQLADVIMILRLEPGSGDAALLSIPRDLWVPIAGTSFSSKINQAYTEGGPATLRETITDYLGIPIHHFVQVDFAGFRDVVAAVGGVEMNFPYPTRDEGSGLHIPEAGCQVLDAEQALHYVRSRNYETFQDGRWVDDNEDDWGRMRRQQDFMRIALSRAIERGVRNPATMNALLDAVGDAVLLDENLTPSMILDIANAFRLFNPGDLGGYSLRDYVTDEWKGGQLALELREGSADPVLDLFRGTAGLEPTPETVRLRVVNGSGATDQAAEVAADLRLAGFTVRSTDNADDTLSRTEVRYAPGQRAEAELLARYLVTAPVLIEDRALTSVSIELATGADYAGLLAEPRQEPPAAAATTTTTIDRRPVGEDTPPDVEVPSEDPPVDAGPC